MTSPTTPAPTPVADSPGINDDPMAAARAIYYAGLAQPQPAAPALADREMAKEWLRFNMPGWADDDLGWNVATADALTEFVSKIRGPLIDIKTAEAVLGVLDVCKKRDRITVIGSALAAARQSIQPAAPAGDEQESDFDKLLWCLRRLKAGNHQELTDTIHSILRAGFHRTPPTGDEIAAAERREQLATEMPMNDCGLTINAGRDGTWLHFRAASGKCASINVENWANSKDGGITAQALRDWASDRQDQATAIRSAADSPTTDRAER